jgi:hypothetical protein
MPAACLLTAFSVMNRVISFCTTSGSSTVPPTATVRIAAVNASSLNTRSFSR